jgi:hypothetical protein
MPTDLIKQDLRAGWLGVGKQYQPLDFLGVALGSYFIYQGVTHRAPDWLTISLGAIMVFIHSQRFFYAPQSRDGLIRLLKHLEVTPAELTGEL